jgi:hypothetical protein
MLKDLAEQNEELKQAYLQLDQEKENECVFFKYIYFLIC